MARDLFDAVVTPAAGVGARSRYTVPLSLVGHGAAVAVLAVTPLLAGAALPGLPSALTYVNYLPLLPPEPARPALPRSDRPASATALVSTSAPALRVDDPSANPGAGPGSGDPAGGISCNVPGMPCVGGGRVGSRFETELTPPPPPDPPAAPTPVRVGGAISPPAKVHHVAPVYPSIARMSRVHGLVILEATIGIDGAVTDARVLRSATLLDAAAVDAVRQWRFTPTRLNGVAVPVVMTVTVQFRLE